MTNEVMQNAKSGRLHPLSTTIIICCYTDKRWLYLRKAIQSALGQHPPAGEVIVVVDHNSALAVRLMHERFENLVIIENTQKPGLSGARNTGIEKSRGDAILFLDDDAVADPELLATLAGTLDDPSVLGAVSEIRPYWEAGRPLWFPNEFLWTLGCTYRGLHPGPIRNLIGASMCVRRTVFDVVGGFDTGLGRTAASLPLGCEETELCIRASSALPNGRFVFEPSGGCDHAIPAQRSTWSYFLHRCWAEGLSKASLSLIAGSASALASEKTYMVRTLPLGIARGVADTLFHARAGGILRAIAIPAGLICTVAGFAIGRTRAIFAFSSRPSSKPSSTLTLE